MYFKHRTPKDLENIIRKSIIGQERGIQTVATALSAHITRILHNRRWPKEKIQKDNLLILGPSGSGKTESIRTVIRECKLPIPMITVSTSGLSNVGYKGKNLDTVVDDLAMEAHRMIKDKPNQFIENSLYNNKDETIRKAAIEKAIIELAQIGIIVFDEFDKIAANGVNEYANQYQQMLQAEMLKIVEGGKGFGETAIGSKIDTTDILFVFSGAFTDLLFPPQQRKIGFNDEFKIVDMSTYDMSYVPSNDDFAAFGFMPELLGRIPLKCRFNKLSEIDLYNILTKSKISPVRDFGTLFNYTNNTLDFKDEALREVARKAFNINAGARGLRTIIGNVLYPILYNVDGETCDSTITITPETLTCGNPIIESDM